MHFDKLVAYLQVAQVQLEAQLQLIQVQFGLSHFPFSNVETFLLIVTTDFILFIFKVIIEFSLSVKEDRFLL